MTDENLIAALITASYAAAAMQEHVESQLFRDAAVRLQELTSGPEVPYLDDSSTGRGPTGPNPELPTDPEDAPLNSANKTCADASRPTGSTTSSIRGA